MHGGIPAAEPTQARRAPSPAPRPGWRERLSPERLVAAAVATGIAFRLFQYLANRSLWFDEALLANNIARRPWSGLLEPLSNGQAAPLGFLFLEKAAVETLGTSEYALRLVPLLAGIASLFLFVAVARRYLSPGAVPVATAVFALSPFLVYYASELKQYSTDVLASLLLLLLAAPLLAGDLSARRAAAFGVAGALLVWLSQTAVFVLAGVSLVVALPRLRETRRLLPFVGAGALWGASFLGSYAASRNSLGDEAFMRAWWRSGFMPLPPRSLEDLAWFPGTFARLFRDPLGPYDSLMGESTLYGPAAMMLAFTAGALWLLARRRAEGLALLLPVGLTLLASGVMLYPFGSERFSGGRLLLFLVPALVLVIGEGAEQVRRALAGPLRPLAWAVVAVLVLGPLAHNLQATPYGRFEIKPLLGYLAEHRQGGDRVYVHHETRPAFAFYAPRFGLRPGDYTLGSCSRLRLDGYLRELGRLRGEKRVWVLFVGGGWGADGVNERELILDYLGRVGRRTDDHVSSGGWLYLYDLSAPPAGADPSPMQIPVVRPLVENECRGPWTYDNE